MEWLGQIHRFLEDEPVWFAGITEVGWRQGHPYRLVVNISDRVLLHLRAPAFSAGDFRQNVRMLNNAQGQVHPHLASTSFSLVLGDLFLEGEIERVERMSPEDSPAE